MRLQFGMTKPATGDPSILWKSCRLYWKIIACRRTYFCNGLDSMEYGLTYWRDGKYEVDFVIERGKDIWALEVKSGGAGMQKGLSGSGQNIRKALMVGGPGIPLEEFFSLINKLYRIVKLL